MSRIPNLMSAVNLTAPRCLELVEEPIPKRRHDHDVLVRVCVVGICGSDIASYIGRPDKQSQYPSRLGHEFSAEVIGVGSENLEDARGKLLTPGSIVAVDPHRPCLKCEMCMRGRQNLCVDSGDPAFQKNGALSEYLVVPSTSCYAVSNSVSVFDAALIEPLAVAIHVMDRARVMFGDNVVILGAGPIGSLIARLACLSGANRVMVFDKFEWRLSQLQSLGVTTQTVSEVDVQQYVHSKTDGNGVDVVIEAAWLDDSVRQAIDVCRIGGRVVFVGTPRHHDSIEIKSSIARRKGLSIEFIRRTNHSFARAVDFVEAGGIATNEIVSHLFGLLDVVEAFEINARYESGVQKVLIDVSR